MVNSNEFSALDVPKSVMTLHNHRGRGGNRQNANKNQDETDETDGFIPVPRSVLEDSALSTSLHCWAPLGSCRKSSSFDKNIAPRHPKLWKIVHFNFVEFDSGLESGTKVGNDLSFGRGSQNWNRWNCIVPFSVFSSLILVLSPQEMQLARHWAIQWNKF